MASFRIYTEELGVVFGNVSPRCGRSWFRLKFLVQPGFASMRIAVECQNLDQRQHVR